MKVRLTDELVEKIQATPRLVSQAFTEEEWPAVERRMEALDALLAGSTVSDVATLKQLDRKTVARLLKLAAERGPKGTLNGYAACVPLKRFAPPAPADAKDAQVPAKGHAFAFETLVRALPDVAARLGKYKGTLPTRSTRSPAFDRLYQGIAKLLRDGGHGDRYPLNTHDGGRRAMQAYLKRMRAQREAEEGAERPETPSIMRVEHLFALQPFDRFEFDELAMDIDAWFALPLVDGTFQLRRVDHLWLLGMWDVGSASGVAGSIVFGSKYDSEDVCDLIAQSISPWTPRELVVPGMQYSPRAWMPGLLAVDGLVPRSVTLALDNDSTHVSNMTRENVTDFRKGVTHYARAGNAEARGTVESRFRRVANELIRYMAGGFIPETKNNERIIVSTLRGERYPLFPEALEDMLDIYLSAGNVSDRSTRDPRTPKFLVDQYLASGVIPWRCPNSAEHIRRLTIRRLNVKISGNRTKKVPPLVYCDYARYRSPQLFGQWSLLGRTFRATYEKPYDVRELTLWDEHGARLFTLHALPPFAAVPHTLKTRVRAAAWNRANRAGPHRPSELHRVVGDIVQNYHEAVRAGASKYPWASNVIASGEVPALAAPQVSRPTLPAPLAGFRPLSGSFRAR